MSTAMGTGTATWQATQDEDLVWEGDSFSMATEVGPAIPKLGDLIFEVDFDGETLPGIGEIVWANSTESQVQWTGWLGDEKQIWVQHSELVHDQFVDGTESNRADYDIWLLQSQ